MELPVSTRRPLGLAVIGGLLFSHLVTLHLARVYYAYLEPAVDGVRARRGRTAVLARPRRARASRGGTPVIEERMRGIS